MSSARNWIDAHCHLADPRITTDLTAMLERSRAAGVTAWVQGGIEPEDWNKQLDLQKRFGSSIVTSFGLHPAWIAMQSSRATIQSALDLLRKRVSQAEAFGEIGLDRSPKYSNAESWELQKWAFREQLAMAHEVNLPLVLHVVRAHGAAIKELQNHAPYPRSGIAHLFTGTYEVAREYLDLGFLISIGSDLTRPGYTKLKESIGKLPVDRLVIETDSPERGNEPANLVKIAGPVAARLGVTAEKLLEISTQNLRQLFSR